MWKPPEPTFVLDAITLRGVGSYLHGARLDIKPLTVLCGANGSGKSTWLKALDLLSESLAAKRLPFGFVTQDWDHTNIQVWNARQKSWLYLKTISQRWSFIKVSLAL